MTLLIHRYWTEGSSGARPPMEPWLGHVIEGLHPGCALNDWSDESLAVFGLEPYVPKTVPHDDARQLTRHRANCVRWFLLEKFGGMWLDCDVIPLEPLPTDVAWTSGYLGGHHMTTALHFPEPHHAVAREMVARISGSGPQPTSAAASGDELLNRVVRQVPADLEKVSFRYDRTGRLRDPNAALIHAYQTGTA